MWTVFLVLLLAAYAAAGTTDWIAEQAYQRAWAESHGIEMGVQE